MQLGSMRKILSFVISLAILIGLLYGLSLPFGNMPPLGSFFNPFEGFWQNANQANTNNQSKILHLPNLKKNGKIVYDSMLIPHIFADNEQDVFFLQGYVHARHRLWQMDFIIRAAKGTLSEVIGEATLSYDRYQRRKGLYKNLEAHAAEVLTDSLSNSILSPYINGINTYIKTLDYKDYPLEFKLLNYKPQLWTVENCIALGKYLSNMLSLSSRDFEYTQARSILGDTIFNLLYPENLIDEAPVVSKPYGWNFENRNKYTAQKDVKDTMVLSFSKKYNSPDNPFGNLDQSHVYASNNWVVSGSKTKKGYPILANDPHLALSLPSIWFISHLITPNYKLYGVTAPGMLGAVIGFNDTIAWGNTNAQRDVLDWYEIIFKSDKKEFYKFENEWLPVEKVIEIIKIKDNSTFYDTVYYTHWGPIVNDDNYEMNDDNKYYSMKWLAQEPSEEFLYIYHIGKSTNYKDFSTKGLPYLSSPGQNVAFASINGDIAMSIQGKYPIKRYQQGKFIMDGSQAKNNWLGYIPNNQRIFEINPKRGYVSSANQFHVDSTYPYYVYHHKYEKYRNRRINRVLDKEIKVSEEDMKNLQLDNFNLQAAESLPFLINQIKESNLSSEEKILLDTLKKWDFHTEANSKATAYYNIWWDLFNDYLWDELLEFEYILPKPYPHVTLHLLKNSEISEFLDIIETEEIEDLKDLATYSFQQVLPFVKDWQTEHTKDFDWGNYKNTTLTHLARLKGFSRSERTAGGKYIVNATSNDWGPSWRMIVSLDPEGVMAEGIYPGGQDGNPASFYYDNFVSDWSKGNYRKMNFSYEYSAYRFLNLYVNNDQKLLKFCKPINYINIYNSIF